MTSRPSIVFVGQGPNRKAWERGRWLGVNKGVNVDADAFAEAYCRRVAVTGAVGEALAAMLGVDRLRFYASVERRNLNARFNGKRGRGDEFDHDEGAIAASRLKTEDFPRYVLLGAAVARCFGFAYSPERGAELLQARAPEEHGFQDGARVLLFPHPSRLSTFWNDRPAADRAAEALRIFYHNR